VVGHILYPIPYQMKIKTNEGVIYNLVSITKQELDYMIENNIIKIHKGQHIGLITGGSHHTKTRMVEEPLYNQMLRLKEKLKVDDK